MSSEELDYTSTEEYSTDDDGIGASQKKKTHRQNKRYKEGSEEDTSEDFSDTGSFETDGE